MKIIRHGTPKEEAVVLRFTCYRCGCVFDAEEGEYKALSRKGEYRCKCPECGAEASEYCKKNGSKVLNKSVMDFDGIRTGNCPHCGNRVNECNDLNKCQNCGKRIIW